MPKFPARPQQPARVVTSAPVARSRARSTSYPITECWWQCGWTPPSLVGTTVIAQPHCHQHSVMGYDVDLALLRATGAEVTTLASCCGLAGNFGMERGHYE